VDDPDLPLVTRARAGDAEAFNALVTLHRGPLERILGRYLKNPADASDAAQDTFLRAFERLASFRGESPFRSWLYRIGVNLALNRLRVTDLSEPDALSDDALFVETLGTTRLVAAEVWRKVSERISELPPKQRMVVELRLFHELSFDEIGAIVDSSEDAAKMNFHHGIKRLRGLVPAP
jgi:RNA polymerase sigma-70 factor, ECF subfamily